RTRSAVPAVDSRRRGDVRHGAGVLMPFTPSEGAGILSAAKHRLSRGRRSRSVAALRMTGAALRMTGAALRMTGAALGMTGALAAQSAAPPIRKIATASAVSTEKLGNIVSVRELPDGRVLVNDGQRRRVLLMDTSLKLVDVVLDSLTEVANEHHVHQLERGVHQQH